MIVMQSEVPLTLPVIVSNACLVFPNLPFVKYSVGNHRPVGLVRNLQKQGAIKHFCVKLLNLSGLTFPQVSFFLILYALFNEYVTPPHHLSPPPDQKIALKCLTCIQYF